ncbi:MAG: hypothetical protein JXR60_03885 [Bacteroidales bacterium]|nr:hypothetical protein [Bacteroidales bacterium]
MQKDNKIVQPNVRIQPVIQKEASNAIVHSKNTQPFNEKVVGSDPIVETDVQEKWFEVISPFKDTSPRVYNALKNAYISLQDTTIIIKIQTPNARKSIEDQLTMITKTAQEYFNNKHIHFSFDVELKEKTTKSLYMASDKLAFFKEKNQQLSSLIDDLNLEL